jgi:hypothetical protein
LSHSQTLENQKAVVSRKVHKAKRKKKTLKIFEQENRKIRPGRAFFFYASLESKYKDFFKTWRWSYLSQLFFSSITERNATKIIPTVAVVCEEAVERLRRQR